MQLKNKKELTTTTISTSTFDSIWVKFFHFIQHLGSLQWREWERREEFDIELLVVGLESKSLMIFGFLSTSIESNSSLCFINNSLAMYNRCESHCDKLRTLIDYCVVTFTSWLSMNIFISQNVNFYLNFAFFLLIKFKGSNPINFFIIFIEFFVQTTLFKQINLFHFLSHQNCHRSIKMLTEKLQYKKIH